MSEIPSPDARAREALEDNPVEIANSFQRLFAQPEGEVFLAWLIDMCSTNHTTFDENPLRMAAAEGRRQVWCAINEILQMTARDIADVQNAVARMRRMGDDDE